MNFCARAALFYLLIHTNAILAAGLSRTPPPAYEETIAPLLSKPEGLKERKPAADTEFTGGEILLYERVIQVQEDGKKLAAVHTVYRAVSEAGVEGLQRDTYAFNRNRQRLHLVLAQTLTADGSSLPVKSDAAFLQTPQRSADDNLYDDQQEAVIIYPDIKPGVVTEQILVEEDLAPRMPGQFSLLNVFAGSWPAQQLRLVVEMPAAMAARLTVTPLGNVPEAERTDCPGGRVRFTWDARNNRRIAPEPARPPLSQSGPCIFLTTLASWDEFMDWYWPQVKPQLVPGETLCRKIDEWTAGTASRDAVIATLLTRASDDVRYTGLEFADGDLVPRPVSTTWENQYGDCKDKACLLVAMLQHKGIRAHPALINTGFPGRIERRSPDYRHFDHCIVAVEKEGGGWIFCDPTVPGLLPGMIGSADGDREVLLVKPGAEWARTPAHDYGKISYDIDAAMDAGGGVSGWCRMEFSGNNAAYQAWQESRDSRERLLDRMSRYLAGFHEGLRVVDLKKYPGWKPGEPYRLEVYFTIPGAGDQILGFMADGNFIPDPGNRRERQTAWPFWRERIEIKSRIKLPPGRVPDTTPPRIESDSLHATASAEWTWSEAERSAGGRFVFVAKSGVVPPGDWPEFAKQMTALRGWISRPLPLKAGETASGAPEPVMDPLDGLVKLPSVDGQINLIEEKYPVNGNPALRRAALEKALEWFPGDLDMVLRAGWRLTSMDLKEARPADALRRVDGFLESARSTAPAEEAASADYMRGLALKQLKRPDEAQAVWKKLAGDDTISGFRRTWAAWQTAMQEFPGNPDAALTALTTAMKWRSENSEVLYPLWAQILLGRGKGDEVKAALATLVRDDAAAAPRILTYLLDYNGDLPPDSCAALLDIARGLGPADSFGAAFVTALRDAGTRHAMTGLAGRLREETSAMLKKHEEAFKSVRLPPEVSSSREFTEAATQLNHKAAQPGHALRYSIEALIRSGDGDDLASLAWDVCRYAEWFSRAQPGPASTSLLDASFALCGLLPETSIFSHEARILHAEWHLAKNRRAEARALLEPIAAAEPPDFESTSINARQRLTELAIADENWAGALTLCEQLAGQSQAAAVTAAYTAVCVQVTQKQWNAAQEWLDRLAALPDKIRHAAPGAARIQALLAFASDRNAALAWWKSSALWWPLWMKHYTSTAPSAARSPLVVPVYADVDQLAAGIGDSLRAGDLAGAAVALHQVANAARLEPDAMLSFAGFATVPASDKALNKSAELVQPAARAAGPHFPKGDTALLRKFTAVTVVIDSRVNDAKGAAASGERLAALPLSGDSNNVIAAVNWLASSMDGSLPLNSAIEFSRKTLAICEDPEVRPNLVFFMARALEREGRAGEAVKLVNDELSAGRLEETNPVTARVKDLQTTLTKSAGREERWTKAAGRAVTAWLLRNKPVWFDHISPASLDAPELSSVEKLLGPETGLSQVEVDKGIVLLAAAGRWPGSRTQLLHRALINIAFSGYQVTPIQRRFNALINLPDWSEADQDTLLTLAFDVAINADNQRLIQPWLLLPVCSRPGSSLSRALSDIRIWARLDLTSPDAVEAAAGKLSLAEPHANSAAIALSFARRLTRLGKFETAQRLAGFLSASKVKFIRDQGQQMTGNIAAAKRLLPIHEALRREFLAAFPGAGEGDAAADARAIVSNDYASTANLDNDTAFRILHAQISQRDFDGSRLDFWTTLHHRGDPRIAFKLRSVLFETMLRESPDDTVRGEVLPVLLELIDIDDAGELAFLERQLAPLRERQNDVKPLMEALRYLDFTVKCRKGTPFDMLAELKLMETSAGRRSAIAQAFRTALANEDNDLLARLPAITPEEWLTSPHIVCQQINAHRLTGNTKALESLRESARRLAGRLLSTGWKNGEDRYLKHVLMLAMALEEPGIIPEAFEEDLPRWLHNPFDLSAMQIGLRWLRQDWEGCARLSAQMLERFPAFHEFRFYNGAACAKLGRHAEARTSLEAFLNIVHDSPFVPAAKAALKGLPPQ